MKDSFEEQRITSHTIRIDRTMCIGSGNCVEVAPEMFILGPDQVVTFVDSPKDIAAERLLEACDICPVDVLVAIDPDGEQIVP